MDVLLPVQVSECLWFRYMIHYCMATVIVFGFICVDLYFMLWLIDAVMLVFFGLN